MEIVSVLMTGQVKLAIIANNAFSFIYFLYSEHFHERNKTARIKRWNSTYFYENASILFSTSLFLLLSAIKIIKRSCRYQACQ